MPLCRACGDDHGTAPHCPRTRGPVTTGPCGTRVDRWDVERLLGSGGFGAVYVARHSVLGTRVAMKLLRPSHAQTGEVVQRFVREARAAASIGSPHIVRVTDFGATPEGDSFLVMELLEGRDVDSVLEQEHTLAPARAVEIARQMLTGLAAAHRVGVIHRDLKPANVFLAQEGGQEVVKLVDFGISKSLNPGEETITRTGVVVGTPAYMAPEQLRGAPVDARTDVYAASVVLYQMISGRKPHEAPTFEQLVLRVCTSDATPLRTVAPDVDPALAAVVERGLARDPASRWPTAEAFADALARLPATSLQRTRAQPFAQTAFAAATPVPPSSSSPLSAAPAAAFPVTMAHSSAASAPYVPPSGPFTPASGPFTPPSGPFAPGPATFIPAASGPATFIPAASGPASALSPSQPWSTPGTPMPQSVRPLPSAVPPPQSSSNVARNVALGCVALVLGGITMGAIAFVTSKLLSTTRAPEPGAPTVVGPPPTASLSPTGPKPPATAPDDDFPSITLGPGGSIHIGGPGSIDVPAPPPPAPPPMPERSGHVTVDEPEVVSQNIDTAIVRRVLHDAQADFDSCRTGTATRVQAQIMFGFGHVTMAHAGNDNTGDHSTAECIAHRFAEHCTNRFSEADGIIDLWANVPAR